MFEFIRERRRRKAEARKIGEAVGALFQTVTEVLEGWRTGHMAARRDLLASVFDEWMVQVEACDELTLKGTLQAEAMSVLARYNQGRSIYLGEALSHMGWAVVHSIDAMHVRDEVRVWVDEIVNDTGRELADLLMDAQHDELARRAGCAAAC